MPFFTSVELSQLGRACRGNSFEDRRDAAIIAVFLATGIRLAELTGIRYHPDDPYRSDVDLDAREVRVRGKGGRPRTVKLTHEAARRLDRYLRVRSRHELAWRPELWLGVGNRGPLDRSGIYQLVVRRGEECGVLLYPHRFRHHFCQTWLDRGGAEGDLMELNGWSSPQMLAATGRARAAPGPAAATTASWRTPGNRDRGKVIALPAGAKGSPYAILSCSSPKSAMSWGGAAEGEGVAWAMIVAQVPGIRMTAGELAWPAPVVRAGSAVRARSRRVPVVRSARPGRAHARGAAPAGGLVRGWDGSGGGGRLGVGAEGEVRVDLGREVLAGGGAGPGAGVPQMELGGLAGVPVPVPGLRVQPVLDDAESGPGGGAEVGEGEGPALLHGADRRLVAKPGQQVIAGLLAQERHVLRCRSPCSRRRRGRRRTRRRSPATAARH